MSESPELPQQPPSVVRAETSPQPDGGDSGPEGAAVAGKGTAVAGKDATPQDSPGGGRSGVPKRLLPALIFAIVGVVSAALAGGAYLYHRATEPDRSTPTIAVRQLLDAAFTKEDAAQVGLFTCSTWHAKDAMSQLRQGIDAGVKVSWGGLTQVSRSGDKAEVRGQLKLSADGFTQVQPWSFEVRQQSGWRVCSANIVPPTGFRAGP